MMFASGVPAWKLEIIECRRAEKIKSDMIPAWKKDLLKRLHAKAEAVKQKLVSETKVHEDKSVSEEHISKISENLFVRKELKRRRSTGKPIPLVAAEMSSQGLSVIRTENIVIIERKDQPEEVCKERHNENLKVELPSVGIVSRLKEKFRDEKKNDKSSCFPKPTTRGRSNTSDNIIKPGTVNRIRNPGFASPPSSPQSRRDSFPADSKLDSLAISPILNQKVASTSFSPRKKKVSIEPLNTTSLHSSGSKQCDETNYAHSREQSCSLTQLSRDTTKLFTKETTSLHSQNCSDQVKSGSVHLSDSGVIKSSEIVSSQICCDPNPQMHIHPQMSRSLVKSDYLPSISNKENVPEILKSSHVSAPHPTRRTKTSYDEAPVHNTSHSCERNLRQRSDKSKIIDLGRISMDPSLLKSKAAIAANEIMKESKTILIIPRRKSSSTVKGKEQPPHQKTITTENASEIDNFDATTDCVSTVLMNPAKTDSIENRDVPDKATEEHDALPTSSIDDVIAQELNEEKTSKVIPKDGDVRKVVKQTNVTLTANGFSSSKDQDLLTSNNEANMPITSNHPPARKSDPKLFVIKSSNNKIVTNRNPTSNHATQSLFGPKVSKPSTAANNNFGRKSFMIDPSKFKKSSTKALSPSSTEKDLPNTNATNSRVIVPKSRSEETIDSQTSKPDEKIQPKGKRKLTVDQIHVIGGYVRLDHSNLAKPNKISKNNHVRFQENDLESIFQYPSERSLLNEEIGSQGSVPSSLSKTSGSLKEGQAVKYTPKYLLAMKEELDEQHSDGEDASPGVTNVLQTKKGANSVHITPLADNKSASFSYSSSNDLLF